MVFDENSVLGFAWHNLPHKDRLTALAGAPRTAWLFGAGASRHFEMNMRGCPMPLARDFFRAFSDLPTSEGLHARVGELTSYVWHTRGITPDLFHEFDEDIEGFMTSVEAHIDDLRRSGATAGSITEESAGAAMVATNMGFIFANVINEAQNGPNSPWYDELLRYCGPNDVFVTLNWDTLLDRSLAATGCWEPNRGYGISFDGVFSGRWLRRVPTDASTHNCGWRILKLHGSTNWLTPYSGVSPATLQTEYILPGYNRVFLYWDGSLPFVTHANRWRGGYAATCYGYYPPSAPARFFPDADLEIPGGRSLVRTRPLLFDVRSQGVEDGVPTSPLLITPVRQKRYSGYSRAIDQLWESAKQSIEDADRIILVGYSFPETDEQVRRLVEDSLLGRPGTKILEVVDLDPELIASRLSDRALKAAANVILHKGTLEDYVTAQAERGPELMRQVAEADDEVKLWIERLFGMRDAGSQLYTQDEDGGPDSG